jgi:hypothetical protein
MGVVVGAGEIEVVNVAGLVVAGLVVAGLVVAGLVGLVERGERRGIIKWPIDSIAVASMFRAECAARTKWIV